MIYLFMADAVCNKKFKCEIHATTLKINSWRYLDTIFIFVLLEGQIAPFHDQTTSTFARSSPRG